MPTSWTRPHYATYLFIVLFTGFTISIAIISDAYNDVKSQQPDDGLALHIANYVSQVYSILVLLNPDASWVDTGAALANRTQIE